MEGIYNYKRNCYLEEQDIEFIVLRFGKISTLSQTNLSSCVRYYLSGVGSTTAHPSPEGGPWGGEGWGPIRFDVWCRPVSLRERDGGSGERG